MTKKIARPGARAGYDLWAETYDTTSNPLVALDRRHTLEHLQPRRGERILDAGCGTGGNLRAIAACGARPVGVDFSHAMLKVAQRALPGVPLAQADLHRDLPFERGRFDALLCALVSEHLQNLRTLFAEAYGVLGDGGRLVFSAFHPEAARGGVEANFERDGVEYRLGAEPHTVDDYLQHIEDAGFRRILWRDYVVDAELVERLPMAAKYLGRPLLFLAEAQR